MIFLCAEYSCASCSNAKIQLCLRETPGPAGIFTYSNCEVRRLSPTCIYICDDNACNTNCANVGYNYTMGKCYHDVMNRGTSCLCTRY